MIEFKIAIMVICAGCFWFGGYKEKFVRRFIMPTILALFCAFYLHSWIPLTMLSCMGIFCLGYGDNSPLRHSLGNGWGRGVWGLLGALALSLGLLVTGHLAWYWFIPYLGLNFTLENALKNIPQGIGDPLIGLGFSSIILLIR